MNKKHKSISYAKWGYIFIAPFFIVYIVFSLIPLLSTFYYSVFESYMSGLTQVGPNFVGFGNFVKLFTPDNSGNVEIIQYFINTMIMWVMGAVPQLLFSLILAVIFTSARLNIKGQRFFKTVIYMPNLVMAAAFSMLFFTLFSNIGPINQMIVANGGQKFDFLWPVLWALIKACLKRLQLTEPPHGRYSARSQCLCLCPYWYMLR